MEVKVIFFVQERFWSSNKAEKDSLLLADTGVGNCLYCVHGDQR